MRHAWIAPIALLGLIAGTVPGADDRPNPLAPKAVLAWPSGPLEVRVALGAPAPPTLPTTLGDLSIGYEAAAASPGGARRSGRVKVAGVLLADQGRTLILRTDPLPTEAAYTIELPGAGPARFTLAGVDATWTEGAEPPDDVKPTLATWLPTVDLAAERSAVERSAEHAAFFQALERPGQLGLRTLLTLPEGKSTLVLESAETFTAELDFAPIEVPAAEGGKVRAEAQIESTGQPVELFVLLPTGAGGRAPSLTVTLRGPDEGEARPIDPARLVLPWAPAAPASAEAPAELPANLAGGDALRGETVFSSETAKCSACHAIDGKGKQVGPELSDVGRRFDLAQLYRAIEAPSAEIHPDYLPFTLAADDGRVAVGVIRAEGPDTLVVTDADAKPARFRRDEVAELRPSATSIMPVGLAGAIGEAGMRDLLAYLAARTKAAATK